MPRTRTFTIVSPYHSQPDQLVADSFADLAVAVCHWFNAWSPCPDGFPKTPNECASIARSAWTGSLSRFGDNFVLIPGDFRSLRDDLGTW